jgi:hypothetical protein
MEIVVNSNSTIDWTGPKFPIKIKKDTAEHLDLFHRCALSVLVEEKMAEIVP